MKLKKGDNVIVIAGKDKGKKGKIVSAFPNDDKVIVEGLNMVKKHQKPRKSGEAGTVLNIAMPINASNVMMLDSKTNKRTRIGKKEVKGKMVRIARKSNQEV